MEEQVNVPQTANRDKLMERVKSRYPDKEFADDEALMGQINDDYDDYDQQLTRYKEDEQKLSDMMNADPRSAYFLAAWHNGEHPMTALVRQFGKEGLEELLENEDKMEEFAKANEEYLARVAKEDELQKEYDANLSNSLSVIDQVQQERGLSDDEIDQALDTLIRLSNDVMMAKFTPEAIDMALKAISYDTAVADAAYEGEVRGRNAKIDEKLRQRSAGDGTAVLDGKNTVARSQTKRSIFDEARDAI